jgi:hypothetical protein
LTDRCDQSNSCAATLIRLEGKQLDLILIVDSSTELNTDPDLVGILQVETNLSFLNEKVDLDHQAVIEIAVEIPKLHAKDVHFDSNLEGTFDEISDYLAIVSTFHVIISLYSAHYLSHTERPVNLNAIIFNALHNLGKRRLVRELLHFV